MSKNGVIEVCAADLSAMSMDELRDLAAVLEVPDRWTIVERQELVAAILPYLE